MGSYMVPRVGAVVVSLHTHEFGLSNDSVTLLTAVRRPGGQSVDTVAHERVAQYLESIGVL
ncbi:MULTISPECIES: hypothetical protein [unclassified Microbacterium]|uniref:hypothetical protein n=1 Tax=unclassified Microbacterium TaxID=2609290 RepID=UPI001786D34F|nr:hypothetical protein [Microbacterium sp. CFBP 8794]MBD8477478.1 hypothetical protein [Microbacterium sp. CFBP 8794]